MPLATGWATLLQDCFKTRPADAMNALRSLSFTLADMARGRTVRVYAQEVIREARLAGMADTFAQLNLIWTGLDIEFKCDIPEPTSTMTLTKFLDDLESKQGVCAQPR